MTEENYKYRTNPMFLRNQFGTDMPILKKISLQDDEKEDLRLIGFDIAKTETDTHFNRFVHFFLYDYKFEDIWNNPDKYIKKLSQYKAVLTPDFSMYIEMNENMQRYNTFRNRWVGAYWQIKVFGLSRQLTGDLKTLSISALMVLKKEAQLQYRLIWQAHTETEQTKKIFLWLATMKCLSVLNLKQSFAIIIRFLK